MAMKVLVLMMPLLIIIKLQLLLLLPLLMLCALLQLLLREIMRRLHATRGLFYEQLAAIMQQQQHSRAE
jgi:hypothetical protein